MSKQLINEYRAELDRLRQVAGNRRESVLREAFKDLLKRWGKQRDLQFVAEHDLITPQKTRIYVDGALLHALRVPFGYWEAKDENDNLDAEIAAKFRKGYPKTNIIFSDDHTAVLWQDGAEVQRVAMDDTDALLNLLTLFFSHERREIADFKRAVKQFAADLPAILNALRDRIAEKNAASKAFASALQAFLQHARDAINPAVSEDDVREMLIQHILTEDIFAKVFNDPDFHRKNNVAAELYKLEETLFDRGEKATLLRALQPYYAGIASTAALIESHSEKQGFLKALYEDFYKAYNRKAADRLGVVYTPGEIVRFMIRSADWLCEKHFGKNLIDPGVEILDPATGTGTFIVELLEHFRGDHEKLHHKYKDEIHANEIAILPYYVANLNIEATYQAITGDFLEFPSLCLVDTLDNVAALGIYSGHQFDLLGALTDENIGRIKRQNRRKISVIVGNPPYNANQQNENDQNQNRSYRHVDERIKATYIRDSQAQKSKVYDMYSRFFRWATDRLGEEGIIAFVTNRSFLSTRTFDGFRKRLVHEFQDIWIVDLGGDVRANPSLSGTKHNVFGIQTGVSIAFLVRRRGKPSPFVRYARRPEQETAEDKLSFIGSASFQGMEWQNLQPNDRGDWLDTEDGEFSQLLQISDKRTKYADSKRQERAIFKLFSLGIVTNRDDWLYGMPGTVAKKVQHFVTVYESERARLSRFGRHDSISGQVDRSIKWTTELEGYLKRGSQLSFDEARLTKSLYRPFTAKETYFAPILTHRPYQQPAIFPSPDSGNSAICFGFEDRIDFAVIATDILPNKDLFLPGAAQVVSRYRFEKSGERVDNITDWALNKFVAHYGKKAGVTKDAIFHYVYAVLHDPVYREKYALNLKREFPRIPFYPDFATWAAWGEALMALHIGYEEVEPWPVERVETASKRAADTHPKPVLKSHPDMGSVTVDADTQITGIPADAWRYRLGNRTAIDWVLDQHKEKTPRDPTVAAKFNTYRFADYKERMIDLLARVVRVSVDTVRITDAMAALPREDWAD